MKANKYDGIAFYSIAQLPPQKKDRKKLYELILKKKKTALFSLENILIKHKGDMNKLEIFLKLKDFLKYSPKKI